MRFNTGMDGREAAMTLRADVYLLYKIKHTSEEKCKF
jgi:hypothetical protein